MIALSHDPSGGRLLASLRALREPPALRAPVLAREVRTPRLLLRPYRMTDDADWMRIERDERIRCGLGWPLRTERGHSGTSGIARAMFLSRCPATSWCSPSNGRAT